MAYTALTNAEIAVKKPLKQSLMQKIKDNFDFLRSVVPDTWLADVQNGSFELDSDSDGVADNWTKALLTNGAYAFDVTTPFHGAQAIKFTRVAGAGNGGGTYESAYIEISEAISPAIEFALKCSAAGIKVIVRYRYFDMAKSHLSDEDVYSSVANPTSWTMVIRWGQPPADSRYMKVLLIGGDTSVDVAGDVYFDAVKVNPFPDVLNEQATIAEGNTLAVSWADLNSVAINVPKGFHQMIGTLQYKVLNAAEPGTARFKISSTYSGASPLTTGIDYQDARLEMAISALAGAQTLYIQGQTVAGSFVMYAKKPAGNIQYVRNRA
jgi:hypothetical protein